MTSPFVTPDRDAPRLAHTVSSPIGRLLLTGDGHALTGLWMLDAGRGSALEAGLTPSPAAFGEVAAQLEEYFAGERKEFTVPLAPSGTPFQLAVWDRAGQDPVRQHGQLRRHRPRAGQAAGRIPGGRPGQRGQPDLRSSCRATG